MSGAAGRFLRGSANRVLRGWARLSTAMRRASRRRHAPRLAVIGPAWFAALFEGEARIVATTARPEVILAGPGAEAAVSEGSGVVAWSGRPFVAAAQADPTRPLHHSAGLPEEWRSLAAAAARRGVPVLSRSAGGAEVDRWLAATAAAHGPYRTALGYTSRHELAAALGRVGREHTAAGGCTVVCVTNRPHRLEHLIANYAKQGDSAQALLVVTNSSGFDIAAVRDRLGAVPGAAVVETDESLTLGACLNVALERVGTRYMAKFDDDDEYGEHFLSDLLLAHSYADAAVVGKHSHFVTVAAEDVTAVRFPGREFEYTSYLAGGTLVIDRHRTGSIRFPDRTLGEDRLFIRRCERAGHLSFAADRFNYVQVRNGEHTWNPGADYLEGLHRVADGRHPEVAML